MIAEAQTLTALLMEEPFAGYAYGYPHKTAYRKFEKPVELRSLWEEDSGPRFFYLHLPFCEMRCGFCNLFTTTGAGADLVDRYLDAVERQMLAWAPFAPAERFVRGAIGGGTPTFLDHRQLVRLFEMIRRALGSFPEDMPLSVEASPSTVTRDRLEVLAEYGVSRLSMGIQSFDPNETKALGRPQDPVNLLTALDLLKAHPFPVLNLDLIYGIPGQTEASWLRSLHELLRWEPTEIYLYPLYVRELTGMKRAGRKPADVRLALYRLGREVLLGSGYRQVSMRLFRKVEAGRAWDTGGLEYCCQEDGMQGFGAGARSYTKRLHYSTEYAVGRVGIRAILEDYVCADTQQMHFTPYGCELVEEEQKRRDVIKSLLRVEGLSETRYRERFGTEAHQDIEELDHLLNEGLAVRTDGVISLTLEGMELSDAIGPYLYSASTKERMRGYEFE